MATVSSLGIGSGLDLSGIVSGLVAAERAPTENRLNAKEANLTTELSAFGALKSSLSLFQGSLSSLKSSTSFNKMEATVSDSSVLTTFATSFADQGSYEVEVTALAKTHSLATSALTAFESVDSTVGTGTLNIQFGTTTTGPYTFTADSSKAAKVITVSEENNNTTLSGLKDYINNNDFGINASIVNDGSGYRLTLTSLNSGAKNSMEITVSDNDGVNTDNTGLSQLAFNASAQTSMTQTVQAQDTTLKVNGLEIHRETRSVTGAIDGVTLNLLKADIGNVITVDVASNASGITDSVQEFVDGFNGLVETINTLTSYDSVEDAGGILIGDFTVRSISSQLRAALSESIQQSNSKFQSLADIGIKSVENGLLQLDTSVFNTALSKYPDDVESIFSFQGRASSSGVSYASATDSTLKGNYAVNITAMATQGTVTGSTLNSLIINANNDTFSLSVDGITSDTITLTQAAYNNGDELAAHIQAQINDDINLKAAGASVQVLYNSIDNVLSISSLKYGSASSVDMLSIDANTTFDLGFTTGSGTVGQDVAGTINGFSANGNGQLLTSTIGDSRGLALSITSGNIGDRGSLSFTRGIVNSLDNLLNSFIGASGSISSREDDLNSRLESLVDERGKLETRIQSLESRLIQQFSALDGLIAQFNSTSSFLTQQLANLPEPNSINRKR